MIIGRIIVGIILLFLQVTSLYFVINYIKKLFVCTEKTSAEVDSVTESERRHEDSKTGKTEYITEYDVDFKYEYNGQIYMFSRIYSKHCKYSKCNNYEIKINPRNPKECWMNEDIKSLIIFASSLLLYAFFDLIYIETLF
jgi:hypothetical protein